MILCGRKNILQKRLTRSRADNIVHCNIVALHKLFHNFGESVMQKEILEMVKQFNENVLNSAKRMGEVNMRTYEKLVAKQAQIVNECFETSTKQMEALSKVKDYKDAVELQSGLMKGCSDKWLANVREAAEMVNVARDEMTAVVEDVVKYTSENVEKASELASKKAA